MQRAVHLVTEEFPPNEGGLERWTERFAGWLSDAGMRVTVYVCGDQRQVRSGGGYELVPLSPLRLPWEEPLAAMTATERFTRERARMNFHILRNEIGKRSSPEARPLLISNFMLTAGQVAALIGQELGIPHIAVMVGTDFSRGFRNAGEKAIIADVCASAAAVVVKNAEQRAAVESSGAQRVVCIPSSIELPTAVPRRSGRREEVQLLSDCGFSFKKGTAVLLNSVERLLEQGRPLRLKLYGSIAREEAAFWTRRLDALVARHGGAMAFPGHVPKDEIRAALAGADVYCSATLGEGSSPGRIAAVCAGLPVVTTRCGEMSEGADDVPHVRLARVADADGFSRQLGIMVDQILGAGVVVDGTFIERWRQRFAPERERGGWLALIGDTVAAR